MKFEFKITAWEQVTVDEQYEEKVTNAIKAGSITSTSDVYDFVNSLGNTDVSHKIMDNTEDQMTIEENDGQATIEVRDDEGEVIWNNEK